MNDTKKSKGKSKSKNKSITKEGENEKNLKKKPSKISTKSSEKKKKENSQEMSESKINKNNINITEIPTNNINNISNINPRKYPQIKCDGCYEGDAICYCVQCGQYYCKICDEQIHIIPANSNHQKKPINFMNFFQKNCYLHKDQVLKLFCESCEEPICHECHMIGPHNNKLHKIVNIVDSYRRKLSYINVIKNKNMTNKYNDLMNQIQYLDNISKQIKEKREDSFEGKKNAIINYESSNLQKSLNDISEVINYLNHIILSDSPDMIDFLIKYKQINEKVEDILAKPIKTKYNILSDDFPHELKEKDKKIKNCENMEQLCQLKDEIIWRLMVDNQDVNINLKEINEKSKLEIEKWAKLSEKYVSELKKYNLFCIFCGCALEENTVNSQCEKNINNEKEELIQIPNSLKNNKGFQSVLGNKMHYFVSSKDNN